MTTLAGFSGVSVNTIRNIETGTSPSTANLLGIARALGTTVGSLLGEDVSDAAAVERALLGWARLTAEQQGRIRETVADLAAARPWGLPG